MDFKKDVNVDERLVEIKSDFVDFLDGRKISLADKYQIVKAFDFACEKHKGQFRHCGDPYIVHPVQVAKGVLEIGLESNAVQAALLHDVMEDCAVKYSEIEKQFNVEVADLVDGLTKIDMAEDKKQFKSIEALKKILFASLKDIRVIIIKLIDKKDNMQTLDVFRPDKRKRIAKEVIDIYVPVAQKLGLYSIKWELEDLCLKYIDPQMFQYIKKKVALKREEREEKIRLVAKELKKILSDEGVRDIKVLGRPKSFYSISKKIKEKEKDISSIYDLYALRIITKKVPDCYQVLYLIHNHYKTIPNRLKDYIANPKPNGYQSIQTTIYSDLIKRPMEIQIRTEQMHKYAEFGIAAHWRYKSLEKDKKFDIKLGWLREVMEWAKNKEEHEEFLELLKFKFFEDEIFVFTPKNDILTLPEGSTPIDFAYLIHSDVGDKTVRAKVNGETVALDKILKNGDVVEVVTDKNSKPNEKWLNFVKTSKARIKIRDVLNLKHSGRKSLDVVDQSKVIKKLLVPKKFKKVKKAGCCQISYGDDVVGILTKDKEFVIHSKYCENVLASLNPKVELCWRKAREEIYTLNLILKNEIGFMLDLLNSLVNSKIIIEKATHKITKDNKIKMSVVVKKNDLIGIDEIVERIKKNEDVISVSYNKSKLNFFM